MKKLKYIIICVGFMSISFSCKKFLSVTPKTQMPQDKLFSTESGFKDALTGVYIQMKEPGLYGGAMTFSTMEYLVSSWDVTSGTTAQALGLFDYGNEGVQASFSTIFSNEYSTIASINAILDNIDANKSVFKTPGLYELIKSECLCLRAYCHLDLLRIFGPVPTDPTNGNQLAYVTHLSNKPNQHISFEEYKTALLKDLSDAEVLSKKVDPILQYSLYDLRNPSPYKNYNPSDDYWAYRYLRANYYAIKALEARADLWFGLKTDAYTNAKEVIDAQNQDGTAKFVFGSSADFAAGNYPLTSEQIFGLYAFNMSDIYTNNFGSGSLKKGSSSSIINSQLYNNSGTDIRESSLWSVVILANQSKCYVINKYNVAKDVTSVNQDFKQIPLLRLSEMYLIAVETAPSSEAQSYWDAFKTARNLTPTTLPADPTQLQLEILKEYRKEFYAEGQAFYAYKRLNAPSSEILFIPSKAIVNYNVPLPASETVN